MAGNPQWNGRIVTEVFGKNKIINKKNENNTKNTYNGSTTVL